jgi:hypothetical protein
MSNAASNQMNVWEQKYHDIVALYGLADELLATVEHAVDPTAQLALVEPLVEAIGDSSDMLTDEYIALCEGNPSRTKSAKSRVEGSLRKVYVAMSEFKTRARDAKNAAHAVVKKIKLQLEQVIANFVEMIVLSFDRIMQKQDVEELKTRHANIALMLYGAGKSPGQTT